MGEDDDALGGVEQLEIRCVAAGIDPLPDRTIFITSPISGSVTVIRLPESGALTAMPTPPGRLAGAATGMMSRGLPG